MTLPTAPHPQNALRVRAVLPQQRMLHQGCGQDYLKNLLKLIFLFHFMISAHSAPHFVKYRAEGFEQSHICLEYLFVFI